MKRAVGIARNGAGRVGLAAAVVVAGVLALSAPASAHAAILSGSTVCSDGSHVVSWSIGNDWPTPMTIVTAVTAMNGQSYPVIGYVSPVYSGQPTTGISTLPGSPGTATLTVHSTWQDGADHTLSTSVAMLQDCSGGGATTTTGSVTTSSEVGGTTISLPGDTTTTEASTTTAGPGTTEAPSTTGGADTTTTDTPVTQAGSTLATTTTQNVPLTQQAVTTVPPGGESLPTTGSSPSLPVIFGAGSLIVGAGLAMRKRRNWTRP